MWCLQAGTTSFLWERGRGYQSSGKEKHFAHEVEASLAQLWAVVAQPLLFGVVSSRSPHDAQIPGRSVHGAPLMPLVCVAGGVVPGLPAHAGRDHREGHPHGADSAPRTVHSSQCIQHCAPRAPLAVDHSSHCIGVCVCAAGADRRDLPDGRGFRRDVQGRALQEGAALRRPLVATPSHTHAMPNSQRVRCSARH